MMKTAYGRTVVLTTTTSTMARPRSLSIKILLLLVASVWNGRTTDAFVVVRHNNNLAGSPAHSHSHKHEQEHDNGAHFPATTKSPSLLLNQDGMAADPPAPQSSPATKVQEARIGELTRTTRRRWASVHASSVTSLAAVVVAFVFFLGLLGSNPLSALAFEGEDVIIGTPLEPVILQMGSASYPVFASIDDISPLSNKLVSIFEKKMSVSKATEALDKGLDSFLAIPDDKVEKFVTTLRSSYQGVVVDDSASSSSSSSSCSPKLAIPTTSLEQWAASSAVQALDSTKVQRLSQKFASANQAIPKTATSLCLPATAQGLQQLWMGQTELTLNIPRPEARAFVTATASAISSVPSAELLSLVPVAKKTFTSNSSSMDKKTIATFETAAKALEKAIQSDVRFQQRFKIVGGGK
jgi:hypothetical protein